MDSDNISAIRREYSLKELDIEGVLPDPIDQFRIWLDEALLSGALEPTAMTLSTSDRNGKISSRTVLLKGVDKRGFVFFTNYLSRKGRELLENPNAALNFFWPELERQVCIRGVVKKVSIGESDEYFQSRPLESRIGAWASMQSSKLKNREELERRVAEYSEKFGKGDVPRPPHWGGYVLSPTEVEFWQGRRNRLHDRICYIQTADGWDIVRLSP
jgi:pyridoxamine 5'-phosphate oxidase